MLLVWDFLGKEKYTWSNTKNMFGSIWIFRTRSPIASAKHILYNQRIHSLAPLDDFTRYSIKYYCISSVVWLINYSSIKVALHNEFISPCGSFRYINGVPFTTFNLQSRPNSSFAIYKNNEVVSFSTSRMFIIVN